MTSDSDTATHHDDSAECEECGGLIDFREVTEFYKTPNERFWHAGCYEQSKTPTHECVYCGAECTFIGDHHREEHPSERYDPVWYMDDVESDTEPRT